MDRERNVHPSWELHNFKMVHLDEFYCRVFNVVQQLITFSILSIVRSIKLSNKNMKKIWQIRVHQLHTNCISDVKQTFEKIGKVRHVTFKVDSLVDFKEDLTSWILAEIVFIKKSDIYHAHRWCDKIYLDGGAIITSRRQIQDYKNHKRNVYVAVRKQFMQWLVIDWPLA